jgi:hypothetical protein
MVAFSLEKKPLECDASGLQQLWNRCSVVDQLSIIVKVFLNSSPGPQCSESSASNAPRRPNCISRRQRHASTRVAKGWIAVDCAALLQKYRPILSTSAQPARWQR